MRGMLKLCVEMDVFAHETYAKMAEACENPELVQVFSRMAIEEQSHVGWWTDLIEAWDQGLIPDIVNDTDSVEHHMQGLHLELLNAVSGEISDLSSDEMLDLAARMEFFMLDPAFGELMDLTEPGGAKSHKHAYSRHLDRLVNAIEMHYSRSDLARFLAHVLRRAWKDNLALSAYASRDPLTALYNRRGMMAHLRQWVSWAQRYDRPLAIALVDVDDFKSINDTHGHAVGDMALRVIADAIGKAVRGSDMVARYGGDEFAIVAPETDAEELEKLLERIVNTVHDTDLKDWDSSRIKLSVSVGGAVASGHLIVEPDADRLLAAADMSLYGAKSAGKDRHGETIVLGEEPVTN